MITTRGYHGDAMMVAMVTMLVAMMMTDVVIISD